MTEGLSGSPGNLPADPALRPDHYRHAPVTQARKAGRVHTKEGNPSAGA